MGARNRPQSCPSPSRLSASSRHARRGHATAGSISRQLTQPGAAPRASVCQPPERLPYTLDRQTDRYRIGALADHVPVERVL